MKYRKLRVGTIIRRGDEIGAIGQEGWHKCVATIGFPVIRLLKFRRPVRKAKR